MKKQILIVIVVLGALVAAYGYYMYNKPVSSLENQKAALSLSANKLLSDYEEDEVQANKIYLDKILEVAGEVDKIEYANGKTSVYLVTENMMSSIICEMEKSNTELKIKKGENISVKGLCSGYLMDVVLVRCLII
jgi:hypothetical protein